MAIQTEDGQTLTDESGSAILAEDETAGPTAPGAPTLTVDEVEASESGIMVSPEAPASNGGDAIIGYEIWHDRNLGAGFTLAGTILAANLVNGFLDRGTLAGETVDVKVRCYNDIGFSDYSATREVTSQGPPPSKGRRRLAIGLGIGL